MNPTALKSLMDELILRKTVYLSSLNATWIDRSNSPNPAEAALIARINELEWVIAELLKLSSGE